MIKALSWPYVLLILAVAFYVASLALPSFSVIKQRSMDSAKIDCNPKFSRNIDPIQLQLCIDDKIQASRSNIHSYGPGLGILLTGWFGIFVGMFAWYGNVFFILALLFGTILKNYKVASILAAFGFLIALQTFMFKSFPADEGGVYDIILQSLGSGFYVWILSLILLTLYFFLKYARAINQSSS